MFVTCAIGARRPLRARRADRRDRAAAGRVLLVRRRAARGRRGRGGDHRRSRSGCSSARSAPGSIRCGRASCGAPRCPTRSPRWSPRRGSRVRRPAPRRSPMWLRSLGATVGRGVWCDSYWLPEPDLVTLGDGATVNRGCVVQTHLFHDRIMSMDTVTLERGRDARPAQRHPAGRDASARTRRSGPASLVMRGEAVPGRQPVERQPDRAVARGARSAARTSRRRDRRRHDRYYAPQSGNGGYPTSSTTTLDARLQASARTGSSGTAVITRSRRSATQHGVSLDLIGLRGDAACASTARAARPSSRRHGKLRVTPPPPLEPGQRVRRRPSRTPAHRGPRRSRWGDDRLGGARRRRAGRVAAHRRADVVPVQRPSRPTRRPTASRVDDRVARTRSSPADALDATCTRGGSDDLDVRADRADADVPRRRCRSGRYARRRVAAGPGRRVGAYFPPARRLRACAPTSPDLPRMIAVFEELFGPYPLDDYAVVVTADELEIPLEAQGIGRLRREPHRRRGGAGAARRARARPPVVRQQRRRREVAGHLAQRGLRLLRGVAVVGAVRRPDGRRARSAPTTRGSRAARRTSSSATPAPIGCSTTGSTSAAR